MKFSYLCSLWIMLLTASQFLLLYKVIALLNQQCCERQAENCIGSYIFDNTEFQMEGFGHDVGRGESLWIHVVSCLEKPAVAGQPGWKLLLVVLVVLYIQVQRNYISLTLAQVI